MTSDELKILFSKTLDKLAKQRNLSKEDILNGNLVLVDSNYNIFIVQTNNEKTTLSYHKLENGSDVNILHSSEFSKLIGGVHDSKMYLDLELTNNIFLNSRGF